MAVGESGIPQKETKMPTKTEPPKLFTLEYCDGYYIESPDGAPGINFEDDKNGEFAHFVLDALNEKLLRDNPTQAQLF